MGARRIRREQRQFDMAKSRRINGVVKVAERERRLRRMLELIRGGKYPYTPAVLSFLSAQIDKPGRLLTQAQIDQFVQKAQAELDAKDKAQAAAGG
jgi:hypothetical protein